MVVALNQLPVPRVDIGPEGAGGKIAHFYFERVLISSQTPLKIKLFESASAIRHENVVSNRVGPDDQRQDFRIYFFAYQFSSTLR